MRSGRLCAIVRVTADRPGLPWMAPDYPRLPCGPTSLEPDDMQVLTTRVPDRSLSMRHEASRPSRPHSGPVGTPTLTPVAGVPFMKQYRAPIGK
jgi:hypothetical protein